MKCDFAYQLARWRCPSINKIATLGFFINPSGCNVHVVNCCPVCANKLQTELDQAQTPYMKEPIGGSDETEQNYSPDPDDVDDPDQPEIDPC